MGTSICMIERHYGALLDGAHHAFEAELDQAAAVDAEARRTRLGLRSAMTPEPS
jgi:hypothetical protein